VQEERGKNYQIFYNSTNPDVKRWVNAPTWIYSDDLSRYVPYIFQDNYASDGFFQIQNGLIGIKIYDYYAEFYSPDMSEIRLFSEMWEVQRYSNKWGDIGAQSGSPMFSISQGETEITITKTFTSWAGTLSIQYIIREGRPLKHTVYFNSVLVDETDYRVKQQWAGIVGTQVEDESGLLTVSSATELSGSSFSFLKGDGTLSIYENQFQAVQYLEPVIVDTHAQGMKADFIFSNWTLSTGESLVIDPDTLTAYHTSKDSHIKEDAADSNFGSEQTLIMRTETSKNWRSLMEWDISSLPEYDAITDCVVKLYVTDTETYDITFSRITGAWTEGGVTWNNKPAVVGAVQMEASGDIGWWTSDNLTSIFTDGSTLGFRVKYSAEDWETVHQFSVRSNEEDYLGDSGPRLVITYTLPNTAPNAPTLNTPANATEAYLAQSVEFDWTFNDPDSGDTQGAYRHEIINASSGVVLNDTGKVVSSNSVTNQVVPSVSGDYYWRVKTWDNSDAEGAWSVNRTLSVIVNQFPSAPVISNPVNNTEYEPATSVNVTWAFNDSDPVDTQSAYHLQISESKNFETTVHDSGKIISTAEFNQTVFPSNVGEYYLRVRTWDDWDFTGNWSDLTFLEVALAVTGGGWSPSPSEPLDTSDDTPAITPVDKKNMNLGIFVIIGVVGTAIFWGELGKKKKPQESPLRRKRKNGSGNKEKVFTKNGKKKDGPKGFKRR